MCLYTTAGSGLLLAELQQIQVYYLFTQKLHQEKNIKAIVDIKLLVFISLIKNFFLVFVKLKAVFFYIT